MNTKSMLKSVLGAFLCLSTGCSSMHSSTPAEPVNVVHVVSYPGENLGKIASWYTGSYENWREILRSNPQISKDKIHLGDRVLIPSRLLVQRAAMPQAFVAGRQGKNRDALARLSDKKADIKSSKKEKAVKDLAKDSKPSAKATVLDKKAKKGKKDASEVVKKEAEKPETVALAVRNEPAKVDFAEPPAVEETSEAAAEIDRPSRSVMFTCRGEECDGLKNRPVTGVGQGVAKAE